MKKLSLIFLVSIFTCLGCANTYKENYKYVDKDELFSCSEVDMALIKEATYAFEDFILKHYTYKNPSLNNSYLNFLHDAQMGLIPKIEFFDDYMYQIFNELKSKKAFWNLSNITLNYDSDIVQCINSEINDETTHKVFDALTSSKTLRTEVYAAALGSDVDLVLTEGALRTYIALDMFYAKFLALDFTLPRDQLIQEVSRLNQEKAGHKAH